MREKHRVGIAGFRGYSGAELVRMLARHPSVETVLLEHRSDPVDRPEPLDSKGPPRVACTPEAVESEGLVLVFLATPADVSMELAPRMLAAGARVVDLSGAFRLQTAADYERWYKEKHTAPDLLAEAVYGLPEICRSRIATARLVANPGCYPTAANLALQPLVERAVIDLRAGVVCDAKSGVSGAGRKPSLKTSFCEVTGNFSAYSVLEHRHVAEVLMVSKLEEAQFSFTAQLLPVDRGILETIYFRAQQLRGPDDLLELYRRRYAGRAFRPPVQTRPVSRPRFRAAHQLLRHRLPVRRKNRTGGGGERDRQPGEGRGRTGHPEHEPHARIPGNRGAAVKVLIKIGGTLLDDPASRLRLAQEIADLSASGAQCVVVHGGGKQMTRFLTERDIETRFVNGLRVTTPEVLDAVLKVFAGSVNRELVAAFVASGARPVGLTGMDGLTTTAEQLSADLGAVGRPVHSDPALIELLVSNGYLPVIACVAGDREGRYYNVNADQMAVACAVALGVSRLFFLTDVEGVRGANQTICPELSASDCAELIEQGIATAGMRAKLEAAMDALARGVERVVIAPGAAAGIVGRLAAGQAVGTCLIAETIGAKTA